MDAPSIETLSTQANTFNDPVYRGVWPQNKKSVEAFLCIATQWKTSFEFVRGVGLKTLWIGLEYSGAKAGLKLAGIKVKPQLWLSIRIMEVAARDALNKEGR